MRILPKFQAAVNFALMMSQMEGGSPVDYNVITDLFLQVSPQNMYSQVVLSLLEQWLVCHCGALYSGEYSSAHFVFWTQRNMIREATSFLLDVLKPNLPEHGMLQTKVNCPNSVIHNWKSYVIIMEFLVSM